jgi:hypothetical protein
VYVADRGNKRVAVFQMSVDDAHLEWIDNYDTTDAEAEEASSFVTFGGGPLKGPCGIACAPRAIVQDDCGDDDGGGRDLICVTDGPSNRVVVFKSRTSDPNGNGTVVGDVGCWGNKPGQFDGPAGVAFAATGDGGRVLFVADRDNDRVQVFKVGTPGGSSSSGSGVVMECVRQIVGFPEPSDLPSPSAVAVYDGGEEDGGQQLVVVANDEDDEPLFKVYNNAVHSGGGDGEGDATDAAEDAEDARFKVHKAVSIDPTDPLDVDDTSLLATPKGGSKGGPSKKKSLFGDDDGAGLSLDDDDDDLFGDFMGGEGEGGGDAAMDDDDEMYVPVCVIRGGEWGGGGVAGGGGSFDIHSTKVFDETN